ncbi:MAG: cupin domain-containing protein [Gammaproteobacteria bacterium]|nr:cupin domain-containing protein [Gammaproteobacteria bacterium]
MSEDTIDLAQNYLLLQPEGSANLLPGGRDFWTQLMSGHPPNPDIQMLLASEHGRLLSVLIMEADWANWEMHPAGDEILFMLDGQATFLLELADGVREIELVPGRALVMPRGVWHTAKVRRPARLLAITAGHGSQHRSV